MSKKFFSFTDSEIIAGSHNSPQSQWGEPRIKVKFMHRGLRRGRSFTGFLRQFPASFPQWGNCLFDFDVDCRDYDWLVVYQDLPRGDTFFTEEKLACPREKTLLVTGEPSTITVFGTDYLRQFGCILTFQEPWAMKHPNVIFHHPGLIWHYGLPFDKGEFVTWDTLAATPPMEKSKVISTVCSERTGNVTLHSTRVDFTWRLKDDLPELDIFGHGVNPMNDKAEALDPYRFHIAVENHVYDHHLTEKLPDAFLGYTLPFYHGLRMPPTISPRKALFPLILMIIGDLSISSGAISPTMNMRIACLLLLRHGVGYWRKRISSPLSVGRFVHRRVTLPVQLWARSFAIVQPCDSRTRSPVFAV